MIEDLTQLGFLDDAALYAPLKPFLFVFVNIGFV